MHFDFCLGMGYESFIPKEISMIKVLHLSVLCFLTVSSSFGSELNTLEKLQQIIKPGKYSGDFNGNRCKFEFSILNNKAILVASNNELELTHELSKTDEVFYQEYRGNFVSQKFTRTTDSTIYSSDTFRIFKPAASDEAYVVIEKENVNNRESERSTVECVF